LGLLDDVIIAPLGLALVVHLTPAEILEAAKLKAMKSKEKPRSYIAAFIFIWLTIMFSSAQWFYYEFIT
jgi:hypothetical protein